MFTVTSGTMCCNGLGGVPGGAFLSTATPTLCAVSRAKQSSQGQPFVGPHRPSQLPHWHWFFCCPQYQSSAGFLPVHPPEPCPPFATRWPALFVTAGTLGALARSGWPVVMISDRAVRVRSSRVAPAPAPAPLSASIENVTSKSQNCSTTEVTT